MTGWKTNVVLTGQVVFSPFKANKKHVDIIIINDSVILEIMQRLYSCGLWYSIMQVVGLPLLN